jgi:hypothetical protein
VLTYGYSGNINLSLHFHLFAIKDAVQEVTNVCESLRSTLYPEKPGILPPPQITLTIANEPLFNNWACVCTRISIKKMGPYDKNNNAMQAIVDMDLLELCIDNTASSTVAVKGTYKQVYQ